MHQIVFIDVQSGCQIIEKRRTDNIRQFVLVVWEKFGGVMLSFKHFAIFYRNYNYSLNEIFHKMLVTLFSLSLKSHIS